MGAPSLSLVCRRSSRAKAILVIKKELYSNYISESTFDILMTFKDFLVMVEPPTKLWSALFSSLLGPKTDLNRILTSIYYWKSTFYPTVMTLFWKLPDLSAPQSFTLSVSLNQISETWITIGLKKKQIASVLFIGPKSSDFFLCRFCTTETPFNQLLSWFRTSKTTRLFWRVELRIHFWLLLAL